MAIRTLGTAILDGFTDSAQWFRQRWALDGSSLRDLSRQRLSHLAFLGFITLHRPWGEGSSQVRKHMSKGDGQGPASYLAMAKLEHLGAPLHPAV